MPKKYARFLPTADSFNLEDFPFYWISQVNAQYVQNIDNVLKKYGLDNSRRRILIALHVKPHASVSISTSARPEVLRRMLASSAKMGWALLAL